MKELSEVAVRRVTAAVLKGERRKAYVTITFLGPTRMRALNREHLGHDRTTDVISFALSTPEGELVGDVYVCRAVAAVQAKALGVPLRQELVRLVVHGILHVLGYDHPAGEGRTRSAMWRKQERYVRRLA
jgi:probable rRNA maturation factor